MQAASQSLCHGRVLTERPLVICPDLFSSDCLRQPSHRRPCVRCHCICVAVSDIRVMRSLANAWMCVSSGVPQALERVLPPRTPLELEIFLWPHVAAVFRSSLYCVPTNRRRPRCTRGLAANCGASCGGRQITNHLAVRTCPIADVWRR